MGQCSSHEQMQNIEQMDYQSLDYNRYSTYQKLESIANGITQNQQINQTYSALIQRIIAARQDHILKLLQVMTNEEKNYLIQKVENLDFETIDSLFHHCYKQGQMDIFKAKLKNNIQLKGTQNLDLIRTRKVGIVFLCGGSSSRLPNKIHKHIGLPSRKCVLQIMMERLKKIIYMSQDDMENVTSLEDFPIAFLVSDMNCYTFKQYLKTKKDFGFPYIHIMQQRSLPVINQYGQMMFEKNEPIITSDGTGTVFKQLYSFMSKFPNLQYIHLVGMDNIAALPLDPQCLSLISENDIDVICKVLETNATQDDKIFFQNGYFKTVETQDSSMTENPENLMKMCLNDMYISVQFLNSLKNSHEKSMKFSQRYHAIRRGNCIQFEKHIQDIMEVANSCYLYQTEDCAFLTDDEKRAVIQLSNVHKRYLKLEGTQDEQLVEITPNISYCGEDLRKIENNITFPLIL